MCDLTVANSFARSIAELHHHWQVMGDMSRVAERATIIEVCGDPRYAGGLPCPPTGGVPIHIPDACRRSQLADCRACGKTEAYFSECPPKELPFPLRLCRWRNDLPAADHRHTG